MKKTKIKTKKQLKKDADDIFSLYIRLKYADWREYVVCYTCNKVAHYKDGMQCGHFVSRGNNTLRYSEDNARVQCVGCNVFKKGNYIEYTMRLIKEKGIEFVEGLRKKGKETHQFTEKELMGIINKYKKKIKQPHDTLQD